MKNKYLISAFVCITFITSCDTQDEASSSAGVSGTVTDTAGDAVASASVILIPATDINTTPITLSSLSATATDDEPLEDLVNDTSKSYQTATTDQNGTYSFTSITDGTYFIYVKPATSDASHLPGGSLCRDATALTNTGLQKDITVSATPSSTATYVGSSSCLKCHRSQGGAKQSGHFNGLRAPGVDSGLQDISRFADFDAALTKFDGTTTVYFYDYDSTRGFDKYKTSETDPGANVSLRVRLLKTGSTYQMELTNVKNPADPNTGITYDVLLTYGGAVYKQRYLTKIANSLYVLPLQYQQEGKETYSPRTRKVWRDYHGATSWYNEATTLLKTPALTKSFDNNCAGCHYNGYALTGNSTSGFIAQAVSDKNGTIDLDGDGDLEEINTGCEVCHGPGSEHVAAGGGGKSIVHPGLLTPERSAMICGRCHSRPIGALGTDVPDNKDGLMMLPGGSRSDFLATYTNGTQLDANPAKDVYTDDKEHSKSHHQQYTDFIRSPLYKNQTKLMTCSNCHDGHGRDEAASNPRQLVASVSDNALCVSCHEDKATITEHTKAKLGVATDMGATCIDCHMPKMAKSGSGRQGNGDYWENDITSHLFAVALKTTPIVAGKTISDALMPLPYTNSCATCHDEDLSQ